MSKGTPVHSLRIPVELEKELQTVMERSEFTRFEGPWTLSALILAGVKEKLRHLERGRKSRKKREKPLTLPNTFRCEECLKEICWEDDSVRVIVNNREVVSCCTSCWVRLETIQLHAVEFVKDSLSPG